ncbi:hypothetical protein BJV78DRAFT_1253591 [Lactifluus subvellereus]|nr:hypothetical protein BJV78DRAFT_1253591 [Lactifluus subvellereus]
MTANGSDIQLSDTVNCQEPGQSLPSHPSASPSPDKSQTTLSLSHSHLPLQDRPVSPQLPSAQGTSRPGTPPPVPTFSSSLTSPVPRKPSRNTVSSATAPPLVLPATQMNLSPEPLPYKHLQ